MQIETHGAKPGSDNRNDSRSVAVIGSGAAGLATAWLLSLSRDVTVFEKDDRLGGHAHTAEVRCRESGATLAVDTGFIVYNTRNYPNFSAWLNHLGVQSQSSDMTFSVSRDNRNFEYKGGSLIDLLAQPANLLRPRFYRMVRDLLRFYRTHNAGELPPENVTMAQLLAQEQYSAEFVNDHLLPFAASIWSTSPGKVLDHPAAAFIRFCNNHGLLELSDRPSWRTVTGGSQVYVNAVRKLLGDAHVRTGVKIDSVQRKPNGVLIQDREGNCEFFDQVVFATHADQTLDILADPDQHEQRLLQSFEYEQNLAILHTDTDLMPRRKRAWASWNYVDTGNHPGENAAMVRDLRKCTVSYWMNNLQNFNHNTNFIVSLNPAVPPRQDSILRTSVYEHPVYNLDTIKAQQQLWSLQGRRNTWFCGAYFGAGFHEDAVQAGLAVAEQLGDFQRPWNIENPSDRIYLDSATPGSIMDAAG